MLEKQKGGGHRTLQLRLSGQILIWGGDTAQSSRTNGVGTPHNIERTNPGAGWVGGGWFIKSDFITHSGTHRITAWIQNPSLSRVWQNIKLAP